MNKNKIVVDNRYIHSTYIHRYVYLPTSHAIISREPFWRITGNRSENLESEKHKKCILDNCLNSHRMGSIFFLSFRIRIVLFSLFLFTFFRHYFLRVYIHSVLCMYVVTCYIHIIKFCYSNVKINILYILCTHIYMLSIFKEADTVPEYIIIVSGFSAAYWRGMYVYTLIFGLPPLFTVFIVSA